jgi:hypothetical protein
MHIPKKLVTLPNPSLESELREFIDEVLVPILVREAVRDLLEENRLACTGSTVAKFARSGNE